MYYRYYKNCYFLLMHCTISHSAIIPSTPTEALIFQHFEDKYKPSYEVFSWIYDPTREQQAQVRRHLYFTFISIFAIPHMYSTLNYASPFPMTFTRIPAKRIAILKTVTCLKEGSAYKLFIIRRLMTPRRRRLRHFGKLIHNKTVG